MTQARDDFAARLNGREYREEMTDAESIEAKSSRLLVIFGASDDLTEFRGIIHDEADAYEGAQHGVLQSYGGWIIFEGDPESRKPVKTKGSLINAKWCPPDLETSWLIKPSVPHATFDIMEGGELYCRGAVIDEVDLLPLQRLVDITISSETPNRMTLFFASELTADDIRGVHEYLKGWSR